MMRNVAIAVLALGGASALMHERSHYEAKFIDWMHEHGVELANGEEFVHRLSVFAANDDFITRHNAEGHSFTVGHNKYSMYTNEEFRSMMNLDAPQPEKIVADRVHDASSVADVPASRDWVAEGAVTGVKDQGGCGSCWAFSTTGCLEGIFKITHGNLESFSEQQLVDCDRGNGDLGCNGGLMDNAFNWIKGNGGLCSESAYPYTSGTSGKRGDCQTSCSNVSGSHVTGFTDVKANSEDDLKTAVAQQPVSVAIDAGSLAFQMYKSGVFTGKCGTNLNHGVLAVGYGNESGQDYWKVKNSWGTSWGQGGYILLERNISDPKGKCGIAMQASYAHL